MTRSSLQLYSEPYGSTGNIGENFRRLLGAPSIDPLQTLIRESVQNIADAAKLGRGPEILIRIRTLTAEQRETLRSRVFTSLPEEPSSRDQIRSTVDLDPLIVLEICDFGTVGLGGRPAPTGFLWERNRQISSTFSAISDRREIPNMGEVLMASARWPSTEQAPAVPSLSTLFLVKLDLKVEG